MGTRMASMFRGWIRAFIFRDDWFHPGDRASKTDATEVTRWFCVMLRVS